MSVIDVGIYRCVARDATGLIIYRINVVAANKKHAQRTATRWIELNDKGYATFDFLDCKRVPLDKRPLVMEWNDEQ